MHPGDGATYYHMSTSNGSTAHVIVVDLSTSKWSIKPTFNSPPMGTTTCGQNHSAGAALNGGFFDVSSGLTVGYVIADGKVLADPTANRLLTNNRSLAPHLAAILNRSELRILEHTDGSVSAQIAAHNDTLPAGTKLKHSLQGGPQVLPSVTAQQEAFIRSDRRGQMVDAIQCNSWAGRTAIGITADGKVMLVCIAGGIQDGSPGVTLQGLANFLQDLGCVSAVNMDGGGSTTMFVCLSKNATGGTPRGKTVCSPYPQRRVASVLLLEYIGP